MSEFGQQYRVFGANEETLRELLVGMKNWSVSEIEVYDQLHSAFHHSNADPEPTDIFRVVEDKTHGYATLDLWNLDMHDDILVALNKQKYTYLTYLYHTGAGFDELCVYVDGKLALTEDLGEVYQFSTESAAADLDLDFDRDDEWGRTFVVVDPPIREAELKKLTDSMGESAVVLHGWESCVSDELPLHYLPGLD